MNENEKEENPTEQVKRTNSSDMQHSIGNRGDLLPKSFLVDNVQFDENANLVQEDEKEGGGKIQESPAFKLNFQSI